jgi:hypothetical protein
VPNRLATQCEAKIRPIAAALDFAPLLEVVVGNESDADLAG